MEAKETKKRKVIDIDPDTFRILSIDAAEKGTNLKALIENSLREKAENLKDSSLYAYLKQTQPVEGYLDEKEKAAFEKEMGL
ncbi:MAG: hypothetical protein HC819_15515 [Cyclobacteriaceae bacterium]|nr:hypothetical protein [Cyclobacteriaceae bacterium]